ncbi:MAG: bifunctional diaminohydroxyphosphoribosylaminopyrimidine deaminase/5-amino-6-(5-phosphoribosylamino)uracil reductase RibD [Planctomycetota bacterium]
MTQPSDQHFMRRALELAARGEGHVEPNPMVGCVIVRDDQIVGEGWHEKFGQRHAEVAAIENATSTDLSGCTAYVTLEPCCHVGKTPPCANALIKAEIGRVVIAMRDPFPKVNGGGILKLESAGIKTEVGIEEEAARQLVAPYLMRVTDSRPWIIAKWAMTLDGKLATASGDSQWISNERSRKIVHAIRGRVDGIMVGRGTALADDPLLTARPSGPRTATRIVLDSGASLPLSSQLVQTSAEAPVLIATSQEASNEAVKGLTESGCEVVRCEGSTHVERLRFLLGNLAERGMTNLLLEGGSQLLGTLVDADLIDEVHAFIAPKIAGGNDALPAIGGSGFNKMCESIQLKPTSIESLDGDIYFRGRTVRS